MAQQFLGYDGNVSTVFMEGSQYLPTDFRNALRNSAIDLAIEVLHDLWTALLPPHLRAGHFLSILERQRIGQVRMLLNLRFIGVGCIRGGWIAAWPRTQSADVQQIHRALVILFSRKVNRNRKTVRRDLGGRADLHVIECRRIFVVRRAFNTNDVAFAQSDSAYSPLHGRIAV